ncbi:MAG TPA: helix-hairpin-helix domain-containing protein [Polyangiales bacterium]
MYALDSSVHQASNTLARLGLSHGYRIDGDSAALNAEIDLAIERADPLPPLALQLWACSEPYRGGALSGFMVAETRVQLPDTPHSFCHDATAFARPPAAAGDYAMVLVLASGEGDGFQVVDFANYPRRERFVVPHMQGSAAYQIDDQRQVNLRVARVWNPRSVQNLSGSLVLQLWAASAPYAGGEPRGTMLASAELGRLAGQASVDSLELRSSLSQPPPEERHVALLLCEWSAEGYVVRDYCAFADAYAGPMRAHAPAPRTIDGATSEPPLQPAQQAADQRRPCLNQVDEAELIQLTGMTKKLAAQLVRARPFKSFDQLLQVRGIGEKTVQKMRKRFTL